MLVPILGDVTNGAIRARAERMNASLLKSERFVASAKAAEQSGKLNEARSLRRRAHDEARLAMRLIGILLVEYDVDVRSAIERTRAILAASKQDAGLQVSRRP